MSADVFQRDCVMLALRQAARKITRRYEDALRPVDLTASQFSILAALLRPEAVPLGPVAEALGMDRTTLTRALSPLERRRLVRSVGKLDDERVRLLELTDAGRQLMQTALPLWHSAQRQSLSRVSGEDWDAAKHVLSKLS